MFWAGLAVLLTGLWQAGNAYETLNSSATITLEDCEKIALNNHPTIRLSGQEVKLAVLKKREAYRAIWPNVSLKGEETQGKAVEDLGTPDFTEQNYGAQITQCIFQGGKLYRTYQQTKSNFLASKAKKSKTEQEVVYGIRESYWDLAKTKKVLGVYGEALKYLEKERSGAEELLKNDIIPRQVYLTVNSQYNQAIYQMESAKAEFEARLWQWTAALGYKTPPAFRPVDSTTTVASEDISLDLCLGLAETNHPDILIQKYSMEAALYGAKVAGSYLWPQIDLNGFYGRSGGAFKGETLTLREDWQLGLKASLYFGGNSMNVSGLKQKTSPKLGQSSRTEIQTLSAAVGLLDGFKQKSDNEDAKLIFEQAQVQMDKTVMDVLNGVREAYANWKKALAQLKTAENDLALSRTDFDVAEIKASHHDAPFSERAVSRNKLAQSEISLMDAQSSYKISLASLNRAVGIADRFGEKQ